MKYEGVCVGGPKRGEWRAAEQSPLVVCSAPKQVFAWPMDISNEPVPITTDYYVWDGVNFRSSETEREFIGFWRWSKMTPQQALSALLTDYRPVKSDVDYSKAEP